MGDSGAEPTRQPDRRMRWHPPLTHTISICQSFRRLTSLIRTDHLTSEESAIQHRASGQRRRSARTAHTHKTPSGGLPAQALPDLPERLSAPTVVELAHERLPERAIRALSAMTELQQRAFQYGREQWSDAGRTDGLSGQVTTLRQRVEQL